MTFEDVIIENCDAKEAKLWQPAHKAAEHPETGITINNPSAENVIRDCATMAIKYLPLMAFGYYSNPFETLKNKFTLEQIREFLENTNLFMEKRQLLRLILDKGRNLLSETPVTHKSSVYGDYDCLPAPSTVTDEYRLCKLFGLI